MKKENEKIEAFRILPEYTKLSRERKIDVLITLIEWCGMEITKLN